MLHLSSTAAGNSGNAHVEAMLLHSHKFKMYWAKDRAQRALLHTLVVWALAWGSWGLVPTPQPICFSVFFNIQLLGNVQKKCWTRAQDFPPPPPQLLGCQVIPALTYSLSQLTSDFLKPCQCTANGRAAESPPTGCAQVKRGDIAWCFEPAHGRCELEPPLGLGECSNQQATTQWKWQHHLHLCVHV